ncbi:hypothetical protein [Sphingobacterium ginsenosidimutans]|uniref:Uncharacterized protein n=1 Tax=Sphingobacterium ginsenosidimutans TaxID=687845 RepID=A0ABP8AA75_9SPHI
MNNQGVAGSSRKTTDGAIRNKERTMQKIISPVGEVLKVQGYAFTYSAFNFKFSDKF